MMSLRVLGRGLSAITVLLLLLSQLAPLLSAQAPVRLATWNVEVLGPPNSVEWNESIRILQRIDADIVAVQEVSDSEVANFGAFATALGYPHRSLSAAGGTLAGGLRTAVMSRLPISFSQSHTSASLSGQSTANDITRVIFEVRVDLPQSAGPFAIYSLHLKAGSQSSDDFRRAVEITRVNQAVQAFRSAFPTAPFAICGDLNDDLGDGPFTRTFTAAPGGLPSSYRLGNDITFPLAYNPFVQLSAQGGVIAAATQEDSTTIFTTRQASGRRLDYLILHGPIQLDGDEVYNSARDNGIDDAPVGQWLRKAGQPLPSGTSGLAADHFPVFADLRVGNPPPATTAGVPGSLVISEFLATPIRTIDPIGEWVELRNVGPSPIDLLDFQIHSGSGQSWTLPSFVVPARGFALLAANALPQLNGGLNPDLIWPLGALQLGPGADELEIRAPSGLVIDRVVFPAQTPGVASERLDIQRAGDPSNFVPATTPFGPGDLGTPGAPNAGEIPPLFSTLTASGTFTAGSTIFLDLRGPLALAGEVYILAAAFSPSPPFLVPPTAHLIPLAQDPLFFLSATPNNGIFQFFTGALNAQARALPRIVLPPGPSLAGIAFFVGGVVLDPLRPSGIGSVVDLLPIVLR